MSYTQNLQERFSTPVKPRCNMTNDELYEHAAELEFALRIAHDQLNNLKSHRHLFEPIQVTLDRIEKLIEIDI